MDTNTALACFCSTKETEQGGTDLRHVGVRCGICRVWHHGRVVMSRWGIHGGRRLSRVGLLLLLLNLARRSLATELRCGNRNILRLAGPRRLLGRRVEDGELGS